MEQIQSVHKSIEDIFLRRNPSCKREHLLWRVDQRLEWTCSHGVGHTVFSLDNNFTHGCDGCCKLTKFSIEFHVPKQEDKILNSEEQKVCETGIDCEDCKFKDDCGAKQ